MQCKRFVLTGPALLSLALLPFTGAAEEAEIADSATQSQVTTFTSPSEPEHQTPSESASSEPAAESDNTVIPASCPTLSNATFTHAINNREPAQTLSSLSANEEQVLFYNAVTDGAGATVYHHWQLNGEAIAEVELSIGSDYWRTWSSKTLAGLALAEGDTLSVKVSTASGCELGVWRATISPAQSAQNAEQTSEKAPLPITEHTPQPAPAVDLSANYLAIAELMSLGDTRGARRAIRHAKRRTQDAEQIKKLDALESDNSALEKLNQLISRRNIPEARALVSTLLSSIPQTSPAYDAIEERNALLNKLSGNPQPSSENFQAAVNE